MKPKFEELHIGQEIWVDKEKNSRKITSLRVYSNGQKTIMARATTYETYFVDDQYKNEINYDIHDISLALPKQKKRFCIWKIEDRYIDIEV